MKHLALILTALPFLTLPAFADVAVLTGSDSFLFEPYLCPTPSTCGLFSGVGEEIDVDRQGNVSNVTDLGESLSGRWGGILDSQTILPAGSIVTGATISISVDSSFSGTTGLVLTGDSTIDSWTVFDSCDGAPPTSFGFSSAPAHTVSGSFTPCAGQNIDVGVSTNGDASLSGSVNTFPTVPGSHIYLGNMFENMSYTVHLDYTVPGEAPEPSEFLPLGLACGFLVLWANYGSLPGKNCSNDKNS